METASERLDRLLEDVEAACPRPLDEWEATAVVESLGYTDDVIAAELGFPDALTLGRHVHARLSERRAAGASPQAAAAAPASGPLTYVRIFFRSFIHALPWIAAFVAERVAPGVAGLPADLAAPFSLAVLGSLVTSGGFIQLIARRGLFHVGAGLPHLARRACSQFTRFGIAVSIVVAFAAVLFGFYQDLFADERLLLAAAYFLILSLLWMKCAELGIWGKWWPLPATFAAGGLGFAAATVAGLDPVFAHLGAAGAALLAATALASLLGRGAGEDTEDLEMPRPTALLQLLAPYFLQGLAYFAFLFADRFVAGSAVAKESGLAFFLDARQARAADVGLLAFFVATALAECVNHAFMERWRRRADRLSLDDVGTLAAELRLIQRRGLAGIACAFTATAALVAFLVPPSGAEAAFVTGTAGAGYLLLALAAYNSMILMSLGRPADVVEVFAAGLLVNVALGHALALVIAPSAAVVGLAAGALVLALSSQRAVLRSLARPDVALHSAW